MKASTTDDKGMAACHLCQSTDLEVASGYSALQRVTSDCKPWPAGGVLARCRTCGLVQTAVGPAWRREAEQIYAEYTIYHQSGGNEQQVFGAGSGAGQPRSEQIIDALRRETAVPAKGRLLDFGCGNGSFLRAWSRRLPGWALAGCEVSDKYRAKIEEIPGSEPLYTGGLRSVPGSFDVISLVHVFEHLPEPMEFLRQVREKLAPEGLLMIEVPDCGLNPYMLLVADHCSHFSPGLLGGVVAAAGFDVVHATNTWVAKEVSVVSRRGTRPSEECAIRLPGAESEKVFNGWQELERIVERVRPLVARPRFGLFGTAIAATWLDGQTGSAAEFFLDEDPLRIGRTHLNRPILAPVDAPRDATVFVALPALLAGKVASRLRELRRDLLVVEP